MFRNGRSLGAEILARKIFYTFLGILSNFIVLISEETNISQMARLPDVSRYLFASLTSRVQAPPAFRFLFEWYTLKLQNDISALQKFTKLRTIAMSQSKNYKLAARHHNKKRNHRRAIIRKERIVSIFKNRPLGAPVESRLPYVIDFSFGPALTYHISSSAWSDLPQEKEMKKYGLENLLIE